MDLPTTTSTVIIKMMSLVEESFSNSVYSKEGHAAIVITNIRERNAVAETSNKAVNSGDSKFR
jgi:hypothetical protein